MGQHQDLLITKEISREASLQAIRARSSTKILFIRTHVNNRSRDRVVLWDDIQHDFKHVNYILGASTVVAFIEGCDLLGMEDGQQQIILMQHKIEEKQVKVLRQHHRMDEGQQKMPQMQKQALDRLASSKTMLNRCSTKHMNSMSTQFHVYFIPPKPERRRCLWQILH